MGRKMNTPQPLVLDTQYEPLVDNFEIIASGQLEQWYYDNTNQFSPDRSVTPLVLTPSISAYDSETDTSYTPSFYSVEWWVNEYDESEGEYVETQVTTVDSSTATYALDGNNLRVKKNVPYAHAVSVKCIARYIDPRDNALKIDVQAEITLTANRDATVVYPEVAITSPSSRSYNPLVDDENSEFDFNGVITNNPVVPSTAKEKKYKANIYGTEEIVQSSSNEDSSVAPILDIRYGENDAVTDQEFMFRQTADGAKPSITDNNAYIERVKGNTVSWNQLIRAEFVDMGLPSGKLWAKCNLDVSQASGFAASQTEYGSYFSWGNTDGHNPINGSFVDVYDWGSSNDGPYASTTGATLTADITYANDAARVNGKAPWIMPSDADFIELSNSSYTTREWITIDGVNGCLVTSIANGNTIFFAASGTGLNNRLLYRGEEGNYWNSHLISENNGGYFNFTPSRIRIGERAKYSGFPIRPVLSSGIFTDGDGHKYYVSTTNKTAYDLTLIYGAGNEPSTEAEFEADYLKWFGKPLSYEDYDAGSLKSVKMSGIKTTGQNQWDEEWEEGMIDDSNGENTTSSNSIRSKNYIQVLPSANYYYHNGSAQNRTVCFYDSNQSFISSDTSDTTTFTTPSNARYVRFSTNSDYGTTYNNDICINISDTDINGTYKAYSGKKANFNVTKLRGRLNGTGSSVYVFPDGMKSAGSAYDEIKVENGVLKAIKRIGSIDLGTLNWLYQLHDSYVLLVEQTFWRTYSRKKANIAIGSKYSVNSSSSPIWQNLSEGEIKGFNNALVVRDSSYTDAATFKTAMSGVMLYYELAEPQEYIIDNAFDFGFKWYGISNGEEVLAETLPWYVEGQDTDTLTVDAMFGDDINVVLRAFKEEGSTELSPSKAYASLQWRIPDIDTRVFSKNGSAVRSDTENMTFDTIVNVKGNVLSDDMKTKHLRFNWKYRKNNVSTETDAGWGNTKTIAASNLRNTIGSINNQASTLVFPYVYVLGPWQVASGTSEDYGKPTTSKDGVTYERTID